MGPKDSGGGPSSRQQQDFPGGGAEQHDLIDLDVDGGEEDDPTTPGTDLWRVVVGAPSAASRPCSGAGEDGTDPASPCSDLAPL